MKKFAIWITMCLFLLMSSSCAYESAYREYAMAQSNMATAAGPLIKLSPDGKVTEIGNPLLPMAMMQMKAPKSEVESLFDWMKFATPFAAIWGIIGSMGSGGSTTQVSGSGNYVGNAAGNQAQWGSPTTTTTVTEFAPPVVE